MIKLWHFSFVYIFPAVLEFRRFNTLINKEHIPLFIRSLYNLDRLPMNISKLKIDKTAGVYKVVIRIKFHCNIQYLIDSKKHCPASLSTMEML